MLQTYCLSAIDRLEEVRKMLVDSIEKPFSRHYKQELRDHVYTMNRILTTTRSNIENIMNHQQDASTQTSPPTKKKREDNPLVVIIKKKDPFVLQTILYLMEQKNLTRSITVSETPPDVVSFVCKNYELSVNIMKILSFVGGRVESLGTHNQFLSIVLSDVHITETEDSISEVINQIAGSPPKSVCLKPVRQCKQKAIVTLSLRTLRTLEVISPNLIMCWGRNYEYEREIFLIRCKRCHEWGHEEPSCTASCHRFECVKFIIAVHQKCTNCYFYIHDELNRSLPHLPYTPDKHILDQIDHGVMAKSCPCYETFKSISLRNKYYEYNNNVDVINALYHLDSSE